MNFFLHICQKYVYAFYKKFPSSVHQCFMRIIELMKKQRNVGTRYLHQSWRKKRIIIDCEHRIFENSAKNKFWKKYILYEFLSTWSHLWSTYIPELSSHNKPFSWNQEIVFSQKKILLFSFSFFGVDFEHFWKQNNFQNEGQWDPPWLNSAEKQQTQSVRPQA